MIVIPVSSNSCDALVANLGHLSVSNSFKLAHDGKDPDGSDAVVVDNMVVELSSVQLLRFEFKCFLTFLMGSTCQALNLSKAM